jgi:hypothetical protein
MLKLLIVQFSEASPRSLFERFLPQGVDEHPQIPSTLDLGFHNHNEQQGDF